MIPNTFQISDIPVIGALYAHLQNNIVADVTGLQDHRKIVCKVSWVHWRPRALQRLQGNGCHFHTNDLR